MYDARHYGRRLENGDTIKLIDLHAPEMARALRRKCYHPGNFNIYTAVLSEGTIWGDKAVGAIYHGSRRIWSTGAEDVAEYCRQVYKEGNHDS